jgi:hypothetical protein
MGLTAESRVSFVPLVVRRRASRAMVGQANGPELIELDSVGVDAIEHLDQGLSVSEVQLELARTHSGQTLDVLGFARELEKLGFIDHVDPLVRSGRNCSPAGSASGGWVWRLFATVCLAASATLAWLLLARGVPLPNGADLLLPGAPIPVAVALAVLCGVLVLGLHELAHVLVGRLYGLRPMVRLSRRLIWSVAETELTGVWLLPATRRWRPVAAGPMADLTLLAVSLSLAEIAAPLAPLARVVATVALLQLVWQLQWYMRTDAYFLMCVLADVVQVRETAWSWLRRSPLSGRELAVARFYALSLPIAGLATLILICWFGLPLVQEMIEAFSRG